MSSSFLPLSPSNPLQRYLYLYHHNRNSLHQIASTLLNQTNDHFIYLMAYNQYFTQPIIPSFLKDFLPFTWLPGHHPILDVLSHCFLASFANSCISLRLLNIGVPKMGFACVLSHFSHVWLCNTMDCSLLHSSVHEILQARILEWVAMPSSREYSQPWDQTHGRFFTTSGTSEYDFV